MKRYHFLPILRRKKIFIGVGVLLTLLAAFGFGRYYQRKLAVEQELAALKNVARLTVSGKKELIDNSDDMPYQLFVPDSKKCHAGCPLILYLHGIGATGHDNLRQLNNIQLLFTKSFQQKYPSFILAPQTETGEQWVNNEIEGPPYLGYSQKRFKESIWLQTTMRLLDELQNKHPQINPLRVYVIGFSSGGAGVWEIISRHPTKFAAAVPITGGSDVATATTIQNIPIWAFHGKTDPIVPISVTQKMIAAIHQAGGSAKLTALDDGHNICQQALRHSGVFEWLFQQQLNSRE